MLLAGYIITGTVTGSRTSLFLYRLPVDYIYSANLLSSENELKRIEGYYSLLDYKILNTDFLIERYKRESYLIKPLIIWLLGYSDNKDKIMEFLSEEYKGAAERIKKEILKTMKKKDPDYYNNFINYLNMKETE